MDKKIEALEYALSMLFKRVVGPDQKKILKDITDRLNQDPPMKAELQNLHNVLSSPDLVNNSHKIVPDRR